MGLARNQVKLSEGCNLALSPSVLLISSGHISVLWPSYAQSSCPLLILSLALCLAIRSLHPRSGTWLLPSSQYPLPCPCPSLLGRPTFRNPPALFLLAPTWGPWVEKENKLAQLPVTVFASRGGPGAQQVAAHHSMWRADQADSHCVLRLGLCHCYPGVAQLHLCSLEHNFGAQGLRSLGAWWRDGISRSSARVAEQLQACRPNFSHPALTLTAGGHL